MIRKITIIAILLVSQTEAWGKGKNNKVVKPDAKNGGKNLAGGKDDDY